MHFRRLAWMLFAVVLPLAAAEPIDAGAVRQSLQKAVKLIQASGQPFFDKSGCISCHNQSLPAMAVSLVREKGIPVDEGIAKQQLKITAAVFGPHRENLLQAVNTVPDSPEVSSYTLVGMAADKYPADQITDAMVHDLAQKQKGDGSWHTTDRRVPLGSSDISVTALSMRSLQLYPIEGRREEFQKRIERARKWLLEAAPKGTEEEVFRLLGLGWSKASQAEIQVGARKLAVEQRPNGGWAQLPTLESDAYATGQALVALHQAAELSTRDSVYQRGARFLFETQLPDGSWHVKTRARGFQPYFESGFPHGHDQWISIAGSSWAIMALALTLEPARLAGR